MKLYDQEAAQRIVSRLKCDHCGKCCMIPPLITLEDLKRMASHLNMKLGEFYEKYVDQTTDNLYLKNPCPFFSQQKKECTIYQARPRVCRLFPFQVDVPIVFGIDWCMIANVIYTAATAGEQPPDCRNEFLLMRKKEIESSLPKPNGNVEFLKSESRCLALPLKDVEILDRSLRKTQSVRVRARAP